MSLEILNSKTRHTREGGYLCFVATKTKIPAFAGMTEIGVGK
jgi:hypothetical protein